ncbi:hypothetical protein EGW08_007659 [Elysia chlorotica]|uniref:Uncharacterized protein n=1 Tax=Elysia chlorotica TaxID=188477 RepID=A0A433TSM5_ELYCH|nr:hypothetical protein EGW08_007659 [Elysia chlorotica]
MMDISKETYLEEVDARHSSEGLIDFNTNSNVKTRGTTNSAKRGNEEEIGDIAKGEKREETSTGDLIKTNSSSRLQPSPKRKERPKKSGAQDSGEAAGSGSANGEAGEMRRVKKIQMGEIPLCPVGLSLSGSGMQLFVKMDNILQKEQLAHLQSQFVANVCRARKPVRRLERRKYDKKRSRQPSTGLGSTGGPYVDDSGVCVQSKDTRPRPTPDSQFKNIPFPSAPSNFSEAPVVDLTGQTQRQLEADDYFSRCHVFVKEEVMPQESEENNACEEIVEDNINSESPLRHGPIARRTATSCVHGKGPSVWKQSSKVKTKFNVDKSVNCSGGTLRNEGTDPKRDQIVQTSPAVDLAFIKPNTVLGNVVGSKKRPMAPVFTSSDLPLKRQSVVGSCSSGEILIYQQRNNSSFFSPVQVSRASQANAFCSTNVNNASQCLPPKPIPEASYSPHAADFGMEHRSVERVDDERESSRYGLVDSASPESLLSTEPLTAQQNPAMFDQDMQDSPDVQDLQPPHDPVNGDVTP